MQQLFTNLLEEVSKHNSKENPKLHTLLIEIVSNLLQIHHQNHSAYTSLNKPKNRINFNAEKFFKN